MLTHIGVGSLPRILEALHNADTLFKSTALAEATSTSADALTVKRKPATISKDSFECAVHGRNLTHNSKECKVIKSVLKDAKKGVYKREKKAKKAEDDEKDDEDARSEAASLAHVVKLASPPCHQQAGTHTDTSWNADSGATAHMTPHKEWINDMEPCRVPVQLANNDVVWANGRGNVIFSPLINGKTTQSVEFKHVLYVPD